MSQGMVLLSGGIDSAVALAWASKKFDRLYAISFLYHLRPQRERLAAFRLLQFFPATLVEVPLPFIKEATDANSELHGQVPEGYVSNRNLIFYSIATHFAETRGCEVLVGGHTEEDQEAFPDASRSFFERFQNLANDAMLLRKIRIELPLIQFSKLKVLQKGIEWNVPIQHTWSCYWDRTVPCGECISCLERAEAFQKIGIADPLLS